MSTDDQYPNIWTRTQHSGYTSSITMSFFGPFKTKHFAVFSFSFSFNFNFFAQIARASFPVANTTTTTTTEKETRTMCIHARGVGIHVVLIKTVIYYFLRCELVFIICSRWILYHKTYKSMLRCYEAKLVKIKRTSTKSLFRAGFVFWLVWCLVECVDWKLDFDV